MQTVKKSTSTLLLLCVFTVSFIILLFKACTRVCCLFIVCVPYVCAPERPAPVPASSPACPCALQNSEQLRDTDSDLILTDGDLTLTYGDTAITVNGASSASGTKSGKRNGSTSEEALERELDSREQEFLSRGTRLVFPMEDHAWDSAPSLADSSSCFFLYISFSLCLSVSIPHSIWYSWAALKTLDDGEGRGKWEIKSLSEKISCVYWTAEDAELWPYCDSRKQTIGIWPFQARNSSWRICGLWLAVGWNFYIYISKRLHWTAKNVKPKYRCEVCLPHKPSVALFMLPPTHTHMDTFFFRSKITNNPSVGFIPHNHSIYYMLCCSLFKCGFRVLV